MIINGSRLALEIINGLKEEVGQLPFQPLICDVLVGNNSVSRQYVNLKKQKALYAGMDFKQVELEEFISEEQLIVEIKNSNQLPNVCGLLIQLPLPKHINRQKVLNAIDPEIDVDILSALARERFYSGKPGFIPPTAAAIMYILDSLSIELRNMNFLVVGQGELVGRPVAHLLRQSNFSVQTADKSTQDLESLLKKADVIISGVGKPKFITGRAIKPGAVVIDAGTAEDSGEVVGDVEIDSVLKMAAWVTPVPGGVGPVTVAMLLKNAVQTAKVKTTSLEGAR